MLMKAYAKINWFLRVTGKREDGYHLLDMLMQQISLHDDVEILPADTLSLEVINAPYIPAQKDNLAYRAAKALQHFSNIQTGAKIILKKRIPVGAGLGGGSADAAAVLHGLNHFWQLNYTKEVLAEIGLPLGADIPFCVHGGYARVQGIGERVYPLQSTRQHWMVVIQPCKGLSTKDVFQALQLRPQNDENNILSVQDALESGKYHLLNQYSNNDLQDISISLRPVIQEALHALRSAGAKYAMMSGSGSAVFGVFNTYQQANSAQKNLNRKYKSCYLTYTIKDPYEVTEFE